MFPIAIPVVFLVRSKTRLFPIAFVANTAAGSIVVAVVAGSIAVVGNIAVESIDEEGKTVVASVEDMQIADAETIECDHEAGLKDYYSHIDQQTDNTVAVAAAADDDAGDGGPWTTQVEKKIDGNFVNVQLMIKDQQADRNLNKAHTHTFFTQSSSSSLWLESLIIIGIEANKCNRWINTNISHNHGNEPLISAHKDVPLQ